MSRGAMRKLVQHTRGQAPVEYPLDRERTLIGREADCPIQVDDPTVSHHHAAILSLKDRCYIEDLKSTNGTLVNGSPIQRHQLRPGDVILIGRVHFGFSESAASDAAKPASSDSDGLIAGFGRFVAIESEPPPPPMPESAVESTMTINAVEMMIGSIQERRAVRKPKGDEKGLVEQEWPRMLELAALFKERVAKDQRVKNFLVSSKGDKILIQAMTRGGEAERNFLIARQHPDGRKSDTLWLLCQGRSEQPFAYADDLMQELLSTLSYLFV